MHNFDIFLEILIGVNKYSVRIAGGMNNIQRRTSEYKCTTSRLSQLFG